MTTESHIRSSPEDRTELEGWMADHNTPQKLGSLMRQLPGETREAEEV
jgi:hypothetical protein